MKGKKISCRPSWGLFLGRPGFRWFRESKVYVKRVIHLLIHGYPEQAKWET